MHTNIHSLQNAEFSMLREVVDTAATVLCSTGLHSLMSSVTAFTGRGKNVAREQINFKHNYDTLSPYKISLVSNFAVCTCNRLLKIRVQWKEQQ
jgi:hypothetical protein